MYKSTSGDGSLLFPVFPRAKTIVFPSCENAGVPSFAFYLYSCSLNKWGVAISFSFSKGAL
jgi:hypothetical protein